MNHFTKNHIETLAVSLGATLREHLENQNTHHKTQAQINFWRMVDHLSGTLERHSTVFTRQRFRSLILYYAHLGRTELVEEVIEDKAPLVEILSRDGEEWFAKRLRGEL